MKARQRTEVEMSSDRVLRVLLFASLFYLVGFFGVKAQPLVWVDWSYPREALGLALDQLFRASIPTPVWAMPVLLGNLWWARARCPYLAQIEAHRLAVRGGDA